MREFHSYFTVPEAALATDEALLRLCEETGEETLRLWESPVPFVVTGYANDPEREVDLPACRAANVPVLRRISGGGTVLQGPGCLNYGVVLRIPPEGELASITGTNRFVMGRLRGAVAKLLKGPVTIEGHTDLAWNGRKFSGNAQKRGRHALLFHGTLLYDCDPALIDRLLRHPSREPGWRDRRGHLGFVGNLPLARAALETAVRECWGVTERLEASVSEQLPSLMEKYQTAKWAPLLRQDIGIATSTPDR